MSTNGPDWTDVAMLVRAMESYHGASLSLVMLSDGSSASSTLRINVVLSRPALPGTQAPAVGLTTVWPNRQNRTMEGCVFRLLHELDAKAGRELWGQAPLLLS